MNLDPQAEQSDAELLEALRAAKVGALDGVYERYGSLVFAFAYRLCGRRSLAEDFSQEVFAKLAAAAPSKDAPLKPWLLRVTRNLFLDHRRRAMLDIDRLRDLSLWPSMPTQTPDEAVDGAARLSRVERALRQLPLKLREAIVLVCMEELSATEAAGVMGISPGATRQRVARGRALLRKELEKS